MVAPKAEETFEGLFPKGTRVVIEPASLSLQALYDLSDKVSGELEASNWIANGVKVDAVSVNVDLNRVELQVAPDRASEAQDLVRTYGDPNIGVELIEPYNAQFVTNTNNSTFGGQTIGPWSNGVYYPQGKCSTAFPVVGYGKEGVVSAEHCAKSPLPPGYFTTRAPDFYYVGSPILSMVSKQNGVEATFLAEREMLPKIWSPTTAKWENYPTVRFGWSDGFPSGVGYYLTAAYTNTRYYMWSGVTGTDITVNDFHHMQRGPGCAQEGDSGGPLYSFVPQNGVDYVAAAGILSFASESTYICEQDHYVFWQKTSRVMPHLGISFMTA